jgi:hypothetical protein
MIKIIKGGAERLVTTGAFNSIFKRQGWEKVEVETLEEFMEGEDLDDFDEDPIDEDDLVDDEDIIDEDDIDDEAKESVKEENNDLLEKPISEMNYKELVEYAKIKGINIEGLKTKKEIKAAIKKAQA